MAQGGGSVRKRALEITGRLEGEDLRGLVSKVTLEKKGKLVRGGEVLDNGYCLGDTLRSSEGQHLTMRSGGDHGE